MIQDSQKEKKEKSIFFWRHYIKRIIIQRLGFSPDKLQGLEMCKFDDSLDKVYTINVNATINVRTPFSLL